MSSSNPFKSVESPEKPPEETPEPTPEVDPARVEELEEQVTVLEEQLAEVESEEAEESKPEPDYTCTGEACEGFAVEEIEPEHVTTQKTLLGDDNRPKRVTCPHCGEEIRAQKLVPKGEQRTEGGGTPLMSNDKAAGKKIRDDFENAEREDVLEEAESRWAA